jgi:hypothetical protein
MSDDNTQVRRVKEPPEGALSGENDPEYDEG